MILPWIGRIVTPAYFDVLHDPGSGKILSAQKNNIGGIITWSISIISGIAYYLYLSRKKIKVVNQERNKKIDFWIRVFYGLVILALILVIVFKLNN
jgi:hypothetical protein